jgi:hypothetical protein
MPITRISCHLKFGRRSLKVLIIDVFVILNTGLQ